MSHFDTEFCCINLRLTSSNKIAMCNKILNGCSGKVRGLPLLKYIVQMANPQPISHFC